MQIIAVRGNDFSDFLGFTFAAMKLPMISAIGIGLIFSGIALLGYQLWQNSPSTISSITLSDLVNIAALSVALVSLYISNQAYNKSLEDSVQQQASLDASRKQLEAVVDTSKKQQQTLIDNLEVSKSLVQLQKEQQEVLAKSLETTKSLYVLQKDERDRMQELTSRKPRIVAFIGAQEILEKSITITMAIGEGLNTGEIPLKIRNVGSATLLHPLIVSSVSNKQLSLRIKGAPLPEAPNHFRSQLSGIDVLDFLPYKTSQKGYSTDLIVGGLSALPSVADFTIEYSLTGENLEVPFTILIKVQFMRKTSKEPASSTAPIQ